MKYLMVVVSAVILSGCTTAVTPVATGGSRSDGVIEMSFEYPALSTPKVDRVAALASAVKRCKTWGYQGAEAFDSGLQTCIAYSGMGCARFRVTTEYQCVHAGEGQAAAASQQKYASQVRSVAASMQCDQSAEMVKSTPESEVWRLGCGDGESLEVRCFDENCYVK